MRFAALALALMAASPASAAPLLHPMFQDHAVLQRDQPIRIYGQAPRGTQISVRLGTASANARAGADGQWSAMLPAMTTGGPYTLEASGGGESQKVSDVLLGDVFLCTGQSNMALSVRRAANFDA
jgi:sialate O-acetylesterase